MLGRQRRTGAFFSESLFEGLVLPGYLLSPPPLSSHIRGTVEDLFRAGFSPLPVNFNMLPPFIITAK